MAFQSTIDNDTVASLPAARFAGRIVIVDKNEQIEEACNDLKRYDVIGFDTETRPSFRAGVSYKVGLLQLSTPDTCYLFRLSHIRLDNRILKILGSRQILKIGADVTGDIRALHALRNFHADGFVDLQVEASRWGIEEKSLRKLSAIVLNMRVSKAQRLSNWEAEILTQQQQEYAATDAWVCIEIMKELQRVEPKSEKLSIISVMPTMQAPATEHHPKHHRRHRNKRREHHSEPQKQ
ncbi:MAG: 3'-5' exonuclease domain-containing protein 2 [Alistipes sp.]|jgi:ribonuclease D|nr:3'-5' exonuclease domain-containing protein 2 [Alistipes sp.]MBO5855904.1 3'-5' exonuclease domain-containing protein 2 [Alistipes sp.]